MLTHANLDAMTSSFIEWFEMDERDHGLLVLPLFHANGIVLGTLSPLRAGGQVTIARRFTRDRFFADVERFRPTFFSAVPAIYAMLNSAADEVHPDMSSVRFAVCGAAPMPAEAIRRFEDALRRQDRRGLRAVRDHDGIDDQPPARRAQAGNGRPAAAGPAGRGRRRGRRCRSRRASAVRSSSPAPSSWPGYLGRPDETARTIVDGWLHTGDIGRFDEDGYLQIVDRIKDMIIRGGENVYPKEIENAFYSHPDVHEVAVVGAPHEVFGEVPVAFVALREGSDATTERPRASRGRSSSPPYKRPAQIITRRRDPEEPRRQDRQAGLRSGLAERTAQPHAMR